MNALHEVKIAFAEEINKLPEELKKQTLKELDLFEGLFNRDIFGITDNSAVGLINKKEAWFIFMLAKISARVNFVGDWCSKLEESLEEK